MIDFSNTENIITPKGEVFSITCNGEILWEKEKYTFLEYIQLEGQQYVDTGIICNQDTKIEMTFTREEDDARYLFGVASDNNNASFTGYQSGISSGSWRFGATYTRPSITINTKHTFTMDKTGVVMDGSLKYYSGSITNFTTPQSLIIGGCNSKSGTVGSIRHIGKIYNFKLWQNDKLLLNYIPCTDGKGYGFYDDVNKIFIPLSI